VFYGVEPLGELLTERLKLRAPKRADSAALDEAIQETLDELVLWLPWARPGHSLGDTRRYLRGARSARNRRQAFEFVIEDQGDGRLLGMVSLHRIDWMRRSGGIGYWVRRSEWGRGIAPEAARAMLDVAFIECGLHRVEVLVAPENKPSQRVVDKVGFVREGVARGAEFVNGSHSDHIQYALLRSDVMSDDA
jgi:RimJ/RimL family protein N-acetyltransferase